MVQKGNKLPPSLNVPDIYNVNEKTSFRIGDSNDFRKESFAIDYNYIYNPTLPVIKPEEKQRSRKDMAQEDYPSFGKISDTLMYKTQGPDPILFDQYNNAFEHPNPKSYYEPYRPELSAPYQYQPSLTPVYEPKYTEPYAAPCKPIQLESNKSLNIADYYTDFTNSFLLPLIK